MPGGIPVPRTPFDVMEGIRRGRPAHTMTPRRCQMLDELNTLIAAGQKVTMADLARRCGLYDYRDVRRILRDLKAMGAVA